MIGYIKDVGPTKKNEKLKKDDLIFGQNTYLKINKKQMLNNNTVVIGSSGAISTLIASVALIVNETKKH